MAKHTIKYKKTDGGKEYTTTVEAPSISSAREYFSRKSPAKWFITGAKKVVSAPKKKGA